MTLKHHHHHNTRAVVSCFAVLKKYSNNENHAVTLTKQSGRHAGAANALN